MSSTTHGTTPYYFVPGPSAYPVMAAIGLLFVILGAAQWINGHEWGAWSLLAGMVIWLGTLFVWFRDSRSAKAKAASTATRSTSRSAGA